MSVRRVLLLSNDHARRVRDQIDEAADHLQSAGLILIRKSLEREQIAQTVARLRSEVDLVVVGGGDGTLNAVVGSLVEAHLPLGILPLGTANDLARTLSIPLQLSAACDVIVQGHLKKIDLGWVNGTYFFNVASLGLSVRLTDQLTKDVKRRYGVLAYPLAASRVLGRYRPFRATLRYDSMELKVKTMQLTIGNGRYYGGGMSVAHDAAIDDQRLDVYSLELTHWWQLFPLFRALRIGRFPEQSAVRTFATTELEVETRKAKRINTDGEITTSTPARFRLIPHALQVYVP